MWLENLLHDTRYALRQLRRAPAFTATALLTLAFGIGANLGVFQLLYAVILAELPVPHPEDVVRIHAARSPFDQSWTISYPAYQRLHSPYTKGNFEFDRVVTGWRGSHPVLDLRLKR
jgi:hypothetical protein